METFRRLRFAWALICLATTAFALFVSFSQSQPLGLPVAFVALVWGLTPYMSSGWFTKLSVVWLVTGVVFSLVAGAGTKELLTVVFAGWAAVALVGWIFAPAAKAVGAHLPFGKNDRAL